MSCGVGCRRSSDPALLWLWRRPVATALIRPLAWEPPYAAGVALKGKEKRVGRNVGRTSDWKKAIVTIDTNPSDKTYLAKGGKETKIATKYKTSIDEFMGA